MLVQCIFHHLTVIYHYAHLHVLSLSAIYLWLIASGINGTYEMPEKFCQLNP